MYTLKGVYKLNQDIFTYHCFPTIGFDNEYEIIFGVILTIKSKLLLVR